MKSLLLFATLLLISACSSLSRHTNENWPRELPPIEYYVHYYNQDPVNKEAISLNQYLRWVKRLYLGWELYNSGWLELSDNLAKTIKDEQKREEAKEKLALIGRVVSPEWAKHKKYSNIKTRHLVVWGNALNESPDHNEQLKIINQVLTDADLLIKGHLSVKDIKANRYYAQGTFEDFEDFGVTF